jgi:aldehyde dehydrogenase (NAD+)
MLSQQRYRHFIDGEWAAPDNDSWFPTYDPARGVVLAELARGAAVDVDRAVLAAERAFSSWQYTDGIERARLLLKMAHKILDEKEHLARLESLDTGKPLSQARTDVDVASRYFEFYGGIADKFGGETIPLPGPYLDYTLREPLGVCAVIIPWNYPLQIGARGIAAPVAVGNTVVLKPAEEASLTTLELARIADDVGFPPGVVNVVTGLGEEAGAALVRHHGVSHVTFTGSVEVGRQVAAEAGQHVVPVTMELGGKSPNIVFASADLQRAIPVVVRSIVQNAGQTCSAGSRLIVEERIHDEVVAGVLERFKALRLGPGVEDPDVGPLISDRQKARVLGFLATAGKSGQPVLQAGQLPSDLAQGNFVLPTLVDRAPLDSQVVQEEIFGPVVAVSTFRTEEEAVTLANGTQYGLVSAIWTRDVGQAHRIARQLKSGQVFINTYGAGGGVEMPFGGYGLSGYGREKGVEALRHYTQVKNVCVHTGV